MPSARARRGTTANIVPALAIILPLTPLILFGVLGLAGVVLVHEAAEIVFIPTRSARPGDGRRMPTG